MTALLLLLGAALAASPGDADYVAPSLAADRVRPATDGGLSLLAEDADLQTDLGVRAVVAWARRPLRWRAADGAVVALLDDVVAVHLSTAVRAGPVQVGARLPVYVAATSELEPGLRGVAGDSSLDLKWTAWSPTEDPTVGAGLLGSVRAGLGAHRRQLGDDGLVGEIGVHGTAPLPSALRLVLNTGVRFQPTVDLAGVAVDDAWWTRAALARPLGDFGASLEAVVDAPLPKPDLVLAGASAEGLVVGWWGDGRERPQVRVGLGAPLSDAPGTPALRVVSGVELRR